MGPRRKSTLAGDFAYVSEKDRLARVVCSPRRWHLIGTATPVAGIPAGTIVGITGADDLVVGPSRTFPPTSTRRPSPSPPPRVGAVGADQGSAALLDGARRRRGLRQQPGQHAWSCGHIGRGGFSRAIRALRRPVGRRRFSTSPCARGWWASWPRRAERRSCSSTFRAEADSDFPHPGEPISARCTYGNGCPAACRPCRSSEGQLVSRSRVTST